MCAGASNCTGSISYLRIVPGSQNQERYCSQHYGRYMGMPGRWLGPSDTWPAERATSTAIEESPVLADALSPSVVALNKILAAIDTAQSVLQRQGNGGGYWAIQLRRAQAEIRTIRDAVRTQEEEGTR